MGDGSRDHGEACEADCAGASAYCEPMEVVAEVGGCGLGMGVDPTGAERTM